MRRKSLHIIRSRALTGYDGVGTGGTLPVGGGIAASSGDLHRWPWSNIW